MIKPIYHLQPEKNWVNDPNGPVFIGKTFHMFYQHNPIAPVWGNMTWGHAISPDMVSWRRLPHALHPDKPYDKDGVFSGCCVVHDGRPHILYTGVKPETLCLAIGDEKGMHFQKHDDNPILTHGGRELKGWRDPYVWKEGGSYRMLIGSGDAEGGFCELYGADDLVRWTPAGRFTGAREHSLPDAMWECPVMMIDGQWAALFISALPSFIVRTVIGRYDGGKFDNGVVGVMDLGDCVYAPNLVRHPDGRWILFAWEKECGDSSERAAQGWQGMLSLPREISVSGGELITRPASELNRLRDRHMLKMEGFKDKIESEPGLHYEVDACIDFSGGGESVIELLRDKEGNSVRILYDGEAVTVVRGKHSGGAAELPAANIKANKKSKLHIYLDATSIEIYINEREVLTTRAYPDKGCTGFTARAVGGSVFERLNVYTLKSCY